MRATPRRVTFGDKWWRSGGAIWRMSSARKEIRDREGLTSTAIPPVNGSNVADCAKVEDCTWTRGCPENLRRVAMKSATSAPIRAKSRGDFAPSTAI